MTVREVFDSVLPAVGKNHETAVAPLGWTKQKISSKMVRNSLKAAELLDILEANGIEPLFRVKETGEIITVRIPGHGRRVRGVSDGVKYDTGKSSAISGTFYADGVHEYDDNGEAQELYIDQQGRYFFAEYNRTDPSKDRVRSVPGGVAAAFIEKYGTEIRNPQN